MFLRLICLSVLLALTPQSQAADTNEVLEVDRAFSKRAVEIGAIGAFREYFTEDAMGFFGKSHPRMGAELIINGLPDSDSGKTLTWKPRDGITAASGDLGYTWGTSMVTTVKDGKTTVNHGKYVNIWIKVDGKWKVMLDMGNSSPGPLPKGYLD